jgi:hypothetical protein
MNRARVATCMSFVASAALLLLPLLSSPAMQRQLRTDFASTLVATAVLSALLGWPWIKSFLRARSPDRTSVWVFSCLAPLVCAGFYEPISSAPTKGLGYNVLLCMLAVWAVYFVTGKLYSPQSGGDAA